MNSQNKATPVGVTKKQSAPIDPEFRRLQLEIEIKKKEEEKKKKAAEERKRKEEERKQKIAEEKRKKDELTAQSKDAKSGSLSRGSISQTPKGAENKSSLSNLDETGDNKKDVKTQGSLKPQSGGSFSAGSEGYLREEDETMEARANRIKSDILQANRDARASNSNVGSRKDEEYDEEFEIKTPQRDAWELKKSIAEKQQKVEEVRRSVYDQQQQQQSKGIREDLPSYRVEESENLGGSRSNFKAQNLVGGSFHDNNNLSNKNIDIAMNSKGFQRKPLPKVESEEKVKDFIGQKQQQTVGAVAVENNLGRIRQNNNAVREPITEKTKQQMEIAMQAKRFMLEQQKAKKKNEEAAIEKKKQILNQLYNKNEAEPPRVSSTHTEERITPVLPDRHEYVPEPPYHHAAAAEEEDEEEEANQQRFEDSIRGSRVQGQYSNDPQEENQQRLGDSIRNSRVQGQRTEEQHYSPREENQYKFENSIRNSRVHEQMPVVEPLVAKQPSPREQEDDKGYWEDGHEEVEDQDEPEDDHEDEEEHYEEERYEDEEEEEDQDDQQEDEEEEEQSPFSHREEDKWGYKKPQYQDDPSGLAELDRRDDWNAYPQKAQPREETRQGIAQSNQKSERGYSKEDYEYDNDEPKSVMSTPYKDDFRQVPQSNAKQNNEWSYDNGPSAKNPHNDMRESIQGNKKQDWNTQYQPEEEYEKPNEGPKLSYAQIYARDKKNTQNNQRMSYDQGAYEDNGRRNNPPLVPQYNSYDQVDNHLATFGRRDYVDNDDSDPEDNGPHSHDQRRAQGQVQVQGPKKNVPVYEKEESEEDYEQEQEEKWGQRHEVTPKMGGAGYSNPMGQSIDRKGPPAYNPEPVRASYENENFNKVKEAFNGSYNKKPSISMEAEKARGKWGNKKHSEEEDVTPKEEKISKGDEDFKTANFGNELPRIRKGWGQDKSESISNTTAASVKDVLREEKKLEEDEEKVLEGYKQTRKEKKEEEVKEEVGALEAKQEKPVLMVFDDEADEIAKEKKMKHIQNMKRRMQDRQDKKERDRSFVKERQTSDITNVSDNEDVEPSSKKPERKYQRQVSDRPVQKLPEIPSAKPALPRNQSANIAKRPPIDKEREREKPEVFEELHSVGPSAKSVKSVTKSPLGSANNIFQKTPTMQGGKKGVIEFSKQSNRPIIKNAINVCLAGEPNRREREEVVTKMNEVTGDVNFIIVFKPISGRHDFRALYAYDINTEEIRKIHSNGNAPTLLDAGLVENYFRYNSGAKEFKHIQGNKNFSRAVDAVSLYPHLFKKVTTDKLY